MYPYNVHHDFFKAEFPEKDPTQCANGVTLHRYGGPTHRDAELELPFTFVAVASFSPFSVRAEAFADIGAQARIGLLLFDYPFHFQDMHHVTRDHRAAAAACQVTLLRVDLLHLSPSSYPHPAPACPQE